MVQARRRDAPKCGQSPDESVAMPKGFGPCRADSCSVNDRRLMQIAVRSILGVSGVPKDRTSATRWLQRAGVEIITLEGDARRPEAVALSGLPPEVRRAVLEQDIEASDLPVGSYDDDAHADMMEATPAMRAAAEAKAAIARDFLAIGSRLIWFRKIAFVRERHGEDGTSEATLARTLRTIKGVDPINFAPALLSEIARVGRPKVDMSDPLGRTF